MKARTPLSIRTCQHWGWQAHLIMVKVVSRLVLACWHSCVGAEATLAQRLAAQDESQIMPYSVGLVQDTCKDQECAK